MRSPKYSDRHLVDADIFNDRCDESERPENRAPVGSPPCIGCVGVRNRNGFTMIEVAVVGALMSLLVVLISGAWRGLGRSSTDATARSRIAQEAGLAAAVLARDFGGSLPEQPTGTKEEGRLLSWLVAGGPELRLYYEGDPDVEIVYFLETETTYGNTQKRLVRRNTGTGSEFTVAAGVDALQLVDQGDDVRIELTLTFRDVTRTYVFVGKGP